MKAVALTRYLPISDIHSLVDVELEKPKPVGRDVLVKVEAVSVNPLDVKIRAPKDQVEKVPRVLGWDVAGIVESVGPDVSLFAPGDKVFYAGSIARQGGNSEFHLVDERVVGRMPQSTSFAKAAALPLTTITAWESLFSRLGISSDGKHEGRSILIVGGSGGVGSIAIQLASRLAKLTVIASASRPASIEWVREQGADYVVNHFLDMPAQIRRAGFDSVDYVLMLNDTDQHFAAVADIVSPQGAICSIVENKAPLPMELLKPKSASFHWESMFTRSAYNTSDLIEQHRLLTTVGALIDAGTIGTTQAKDLGKICATNMREAHRLLEEGRTIGKLTLTGF